MLRRLAAWLAGVWAGETLAVGFVAAPALFAVIERNDAGRLAARLFANDAYAGLALGFVLFMATLQIARQDAESGRGSRFSTDMLLALAALFATIAGHFGLQPMMEAARHGAAAPSFAALHGAALVFFAIKGTAAAVLAWRLSAAPRSAATGGRP